MSRTWALEVKMWLRLLGVILRKRSANYFRAYQGTQEEKTCFTDGTDIRYRGGRPFQS